MGTIYMYHVHVHVWVQYIGVVELYVHIHVHVLASSAVIQKTGKGLGTNTCRVEKFMILHV